MSTRAWQSCHSDLGGTFFKVRHGGVLTFSLLLWNLLGLCLVQTLGVGLRFDVPVVRCFPRRRISSSISAVVVSSGVVQPFFSPLSREGVGWGLWVRHCRSQRLDERSTTRLEVPALTIFDSKGFSSLLVAAERSSGLGGFSVGCQLYVKS
jgi:hypothetical protein